jgi:large subunit ribosomal protein L4
MDETGESTVGPESEVGGDVEGGPETAGPETAGPEVAAAPEAGAAPPRAPLFGPGGERLGEVELDAWWFGIEPHRAVLHQVVTAQLAAGRAGTHSTRTRAEVRGGGAKPYRQKGTGRARQGSTRAPHWSGGGIAHGPKPRSYVERTPKKMVTLALRSALSDRAAEGRVAVVRDFHPSVPRTKDAAALLSSLGAVGRVLAVVARDDEAARKSLANLAFVEIRGGRAGAAVSLAATDVLRADWVVFQEEMVPTGRPSWAERGRLREEVA